MVEQIENNILTLKDDFNNDSTKIGIALLKAYRIARIKYNNEKWPAIRSKGNNIAAHYDSLIQFYIKEQKQLLDIMLSTKDSNNIGVIREFFEAKIDTSFKMRYKLAQKALQLPGANDEDYGVYIYVLCEKKEELKEECEKFITKKFVDQNVNHAIIGVFKKCSSCLEDYIIDEEILKYYLKAQELGSSEKNFESPYNFSNDINRIKEKIKAKQQYKISN